ncbi:RNA polymerase II-associated protein 1 domain containing protein [Aphelenchoides bicaudatus]|nr:RNA polymerase II-associated protein 1 domain containing protein [Aphelenchoides bicaudatus]
MSAPRKPKVFNTLDSEKSLQGRFNVELDPIEERNEEQIVQPIRERLPGFFDFPEKCQPYKFAETGCEAYSTEDGFPQVLDLSAYHTGSAQEEPERQAQKGMSIFATEFERLHGDLSKVEPPQFPGTSSASEPVNPENFDQIEQENIKRIEQMDKDEIQQSLKEIYERLDPNTIQFLRDRSKKDANKSKVSLFKQRSQKAKEEGKPVTQSVESKPEVETENSEFVKQLEVISDDVLANDEQLNEYSRLAMDPMHMDFATKYMRSVVPSQERNLIRLFDKLRISPKNYDGKDELINLARSKLDKICEIYLEEYVTENGRKERRFAKDVNPIVNSSWSLVPVRRVVDAQAIRGECAQDDIEIVELALLWTVLLFCEQPTYFHLVHGVPGDIYCRLAEVYLLGPDIFKTATIEKCMDLLIKDFLLVKAGEGKLSLKLIKSISGLDAFLPFYEDLLKHFLEFSYGDPRFSILLLMAAYMNSSLGDALTMRCLLWSTATDVIRQMGIKQEDIVPILEYVRRNLKATTTLFREQFPDQMNVLLTAYDNATKKGLVTMERNPGVYQLASEQLKFVVES